MSISICSHTFTDGTHCQAAAIRGQHYCQWHRTEADRRRRSRRHQTLSRRRALPVTIAGHSSDMLRNLQHVLDALLQERISGKAAGVLLYGMSMAQYRSDL